MANETLDFANVRTVGERLRYQRQVNGYSMRDVHAKTGIAISHISSLERGICSPGSIILGKLAALYRVPVHWLLGETSPLPASAQVRVSVMIGTMPVLTIEHNPSTDERKCWVNQQSVAALPPAVAGALMHALSVARLEPTEGKH